MISSRVSRVFFIIKIFPSQCFPVFWKQRFSFWLCSFFGSLSYAAFFRVFIAGVWLWVAFNYTKFFPHLQINGSYFFPFLNVSFFASVSSKSMVEPFKSTLLFHRRVFHKIVCCLGLFWPSRESDCQTPFISCPASK